VLVDALDGDAAGAILRAATGESADLVVMATRARTGLGRLLLGSVAGRVARRATVPVLLVKAGVPAAVTSP
jgi:nucleotide-binding universal stress UspA family protein